MSEIAHIGAPTSAPAATRLIPLLLVAAVAVGACIDIQSPEDALRIRAPSGLEPPLEAALQAFEGTLSGNPPRIVYGATERHARRITDEQPDAAVLLTDHPAWADYVAQRAAVASRRVIARDTLVVVTAPGGTRIVGDLSALVDPAFERIAVPSTEAASAGMYAREALLRYGLWSGLAGRIERAADAADALERVMSARADAAIVLGSEARAAGVSPALRIDPAYHQPAWIEALLLREEPRSRALFDFLTSPQTMSTFESNGFEAPEPAISGTP